MSLSVLSKDLPAIMAVLWFVHAIYRQRHNAGGSTEERTMIEMIGILFAVQGIGGLINNLQADSGKSWFLVNHIEALNGLEIPISIALIVIGGVLVGGKYLLKEQQKK